MAIESLLPIGFELPDGARCGRVLHGTRSWQIVATDGGGRALIAEWELTSKWIATSLIELADMRKFSFGGETLFEVSCGPSQLLAPVNECRSPANSSEALAFATALRDTRAIDPQSTLNDALYVEKLGRILPAYGIANLTEDDVLLGGWLTGGIAVSAKSYSRLHQIVSWLAPKDLLNVIQVAGFQTEELPTIPSQNLVKGQSSAEEQHIASNKIGRFELPGRLDLEQFFEEHVVDIIRNKDRYRAVGIDFPSGIVLHGPPGCGKTFAVERLIEFLGWPIFQIDASTIASPYIHETSRKIAEVFKEAITKSPSVLVIDEMEAFLADRGNEGAAVNHRVEEIAEFLRRIPEAIKNEVLIIAMTNRADMIDPAILRRGRFDHIVKVDFADAGDIVALLTKLLATLPKDGSVDAKLIANNLVGRSLSDVAFVVREGSRLAARAGANEINQEHLLQALDRTISEKNENPSRRIGFI